MHHQHPPTYPPPPSRRAPAPVRQFVTLADSHGLGTAPRVMDGLGGDYTPGECKAPSLLWRQKPPPTLSPPPYRALFCSEMKSILDMPVMLEKMDS